MKKKKKTCYNLVKIVTSYKDLLYTMKQGRFRQLKICQLTFMRVKMSSNLNMNGSLWGHFITVLCVCVEGG